MANYISLSETKIYLGITSSDTTQDNKLNLIINGVQDIVEGYIGDISLTEKTENIYLCDLACYGKIFLKNKNITAVTKINGVAYTGVLGTNYMIDNTKVIINDLNLYLSDLKFPYFSISYTSGYSTIPDDIKLAMLTLTAQEFNKQNGGLVKMYKLGPRTVEFDNTDGQADGVLNSIKGILAKYKAFTLNRI